MFFSQTFIIQDLQKEIMLYKTIDFIPCWIFHLPLLHGSRHQQNFTQKLRDYTQHHKRQQPSSYQVNKQYQNGEQQSFIKFGHLPSTSKMITRHVLLNDDSATTVTNRLHSKYPAFESYNKDLSKVYHHSKNLSMHYLPNKTSTMKAINGYEVHRDCYWNTDGRQEIPCILNPYPLYEMIRKFPNVDIHKLYHNSVISLSQPFNHKQKLIKMLLTYETGENAYLPCHTLGAEDSELKVLSGQGCKSTSENGFSLANSISKVRSTNIITSSPQSNCAGPKISTYE
ncbi:hypothetical protein Smp_180720 [Schistosoma mansoni]|uniref:hypothetical protein n=1 Tax=Schistosoma mansoni TaxID=6183 RepID=UPI0001A62B52|nr:hypothetical protein Smp_180720 [Schistosoma mansoni]|eukprot:XP_018647244.1 hypothetical protein Smp_180720 [Schistosoma mansoni]